MSLHSHIRTYDNFLFRELRSGTGSVNEYRHLNKVFWREREAGFSIPEHRVVEDINDNLWLQVERIEGVPGHKFVTTEMTVKPSMISYPPTPAVLNKS